MDSEKTEAPQEDVVEPPFEEAVRETVPSHAGTKNLNRAGRPKGSMGRVQGIVRQAILEAEPEKFLIRVMEGRAHKRAGSEGGRRTVTVFPTLQESVAAAEALLRKVAADLKAVEVTGDEDNPVTLQVNRAMQDNPREQARRLEVLLTSAGLAGVVEQALAAGEDNAPALEAPKTLADGVETPEAPETSEDPPGARPEVSNANAEPEQDGEMKSPEAGQKLVFAGCSVEVEARAQRPGDPPLYVARRDGRELRVGSWSYIELLLKKLLGDPLPRGEIRSTQARSAFHPKAEIARRKIG